MTVASMAFFYSLFLFLEVIKV